MNSPFRYQHLIDLLTGWEKTTYPLDAFISRYFRNNRSAGAKDRKWITEHAYLLVRWKTFLDYKEKKPSWITRYERLLHPLPIDVIKKAPRYLQCAFPKWYYQKLEESYGDQAFSLCQTLNEEAPTTVRVNTYLTDRKTLFAKWAPLYPVYLTKLSPMGISFRKRINFFALDEFKQGLFEVQDEGSQLIALFTKAKPKEKILDYCSGSGGKSLALAPFMEGSGQLFLHDIRTSALVQAKKRLKRAHIQNAQIVLPEKKAKRRLKGNMDTVLLDVPCSGSGTLRRNPDMKWKSTLSGMLALVETQKMLFQEALLYVKKGGKIIYSTCSLFPDENQDQVAYFLEHFPVKLLEQKQILPVSQAHDGFFMAAFQAFC